MSTRGELDQLYNQKRAIVVEELYLTGEALNQAYAKEDEIQKRINQLERLRCDDCGQYAKAEDLEEREPWQNGMAHRKGKGCNRLKSILEVKKH